MRRVTFELVTGFSKTAHVRPAHLRYEIWIPPGTGIIFCREAQRQQVSIFVETSGRDIAMFK